MYVGKSNWLPCWLPKVWQVSHQRLISQNVYISQMPPPSVNKTAHSDFKTQKAKKQGYQWPHKKDLLKKFYFPKDSISLHSHIQIIAIFLSFISSLCQDLGSNSVEKFSNESRFRFQFLILESRIKDGNAEITLY